MEIGLHNRHQGTAPRNAASVGGDGADDRRDGRLHQSQERWTSGPADDVDRPTKNARLRNRVGRVRSASEEKLWVTMRATPWDRRLRTYFCPERAKQPPRHGCLALSGLRRISTPYDPRALPSSLPITFLRLRTERV